MVGLLVFMPVTWLLAVGGLLAVGATPGVAIVAPLVLLLGAAALLA